MINYILKSYLLINFNEGYLKLRAPVVVLRRQVKAPAKTLFFLAFVKLAFDINVSFVCKDEDLSKCYLFPDFCSK